MNLESFSYRLLAVFMVFFVTNCSSVTKDKYILPNGYRGFFGVLYQSDKHYAQVKEAGKRVFEVSSNGVCESGFGFAKGPIKQEFYYQNGQKIKDVGFVMLGRLDIPINQSELKIISNNPVKIFAIFIYSANIDGGDNSYAIYCVTSGYNIISFLKRGESIYEYLMIGYDFDWQENKKIMVKNIARLNKELVEKKPPFN